MSAPPLAVPRARPAAPAAVDARTVRIAALCALGLFGALHWAGLVEPRAGWALTAMVAVGVGAGLRLALVEQERGRLNRIAQRVAIGFAVVMLTLWLAGVPTHTLRPDRWDQLLAGVGEGLAALPGLRIPYRGIDEWTRAVILSGGGLLLAGAGWLALSERRPRIVGAAVCLSVLYAVPIVEHGPRAPYLDGAVFAVLLAAFLWGERLRGPEAPLAGALLGVAVIAGALTAPHVDAQKPWIDYEKLAESLQAGKSTTYAWNHTYAPLTWPRDGREMAKIAARAPAYWKTEALEDFDGYAWRQTPSAGPGGVDVAADDVEAHRGWIQHLRVDIAGLRSTAFVGAGTTLRVFNARAPGPSTPGTFRTLTKPLHRGDSYDAMSYVPRPSEQQMRAAGTAYPAFVERQLTMELPRVAGQPGTTDLGRVTVSFPAFGSGGIPVGRVESGFFALDALDALRRSPYRRMYELAQTLAAGSRDPYDFARQVQARVRRDATYTEDPPNPGRLLPLDAFLFRDHAGYCQHFSGAMALLLRMGGVPARVATGFSPGSRDGERFVVRDVDAHSWVEAYFPGIGWVTFDPTPADSPARSQLADLERPSQAPGARRRATAPGDRASDPTAGGAARVPAGDSSGPWGTAAIAAAMLAALAAAAVLVLRRRGVLGRVSDLEELHRALARSGRAATPDLTLHRIETLLGGSPEAGGYLRALRLTRYGGVEADPTPAQRRALRRELGAGLGLRGRLRALWALPPRPRELVPRLRRRPVRPYTG